MQHCCTGETEIERIAKNISFHDLGTLKVYKFRIQFESFKDVTQFYGKTPFG